MAERYEDRYRYGRNRRDREYADDRGYMDRAGDEIRSWFGDDEAERRRRMDEERDRARESEPRRWGNEGRTSDTRWRSTGDYDEGRRYSGSAEWRDRDRAARDWSDRDRSPRDTAPRSESVWSTDDGRTQFGRGISASGAGRYASRDAGDRGYGGYGASYGRDDDREYGERDDAARGYGYSGRDYGSREYGSRDYGRADYGGTYGYGARDSGTTAYGGRDAASRDYPSRDSTSRDYTGRGPKGYQRSDSRIYEDVCDRLSHADVDASNIEVSVKDGEVTLSGTVRHRSDKRRAEDVAEEVSGVREVHNSVRVDRETSAGIGHSETSTSNQPGSMLGLSPTPNPATGGTTPSATKRSTS